MADFNVGDIVFIKVVIIVGGAYTENDYSFYCLSSDTWDDAQDGIIEVMDLVYNLLNGVMSPDATVTEYQIKNLTTGVDWGAVPSGVGAGTAATDALPQGVAGLVTFSTNVNRRRGRKFIPGLTEGGVAAQLWGSAVLTALGDYAAQLLATLTGGPTDFSMQYVVTAGDDPLAYSLPTEALVRDIPAYQRRRKPGVGM